MRKALSFGYPLTALAVSLLGQTFFGSIVGTLTDASGSSVPGAVVTLTNTGTSERRTAESDSLGNYQFVNLVPGRYKIEIEKTGFKRITRDDVVVEVQAAVRIDVAMQVGEVGQTVEVMAQTSLLQTESASLGQVVEARKVQEMPLNGRNVLNLVALVPGVVPQGFAMTNPTGQNIFAFGNYQIGGGIAGQNASYIDGAPLNVAQGSLIAIVPTQDAIQEFRVQTNSLGPEFGRFTGGVISLTSKSGANEFHGSAYEFLRNRVLNANTFFNNRNSTARPAFTQNQFGANIGGPVIKDKTFFFFAYEGFRQRYGQSFTSSVPTDAFRAGDFSKLPITIYDSLTTCGVLGNGACANGQTVLRQPFPGNIIPASRLNGAAKVMTAMWAEPNAPGTGSTGVVNNWTGNASVGGNNDQYNSRVDQNLSEKQRLFGRATYWTNLSLPIEPYKGTKVCTDRCTETFQVHQFVAGDTYSFSPSFLGEFRAAFLRFAYFRVPLSLGEDLTKYGWPAFMNTQVAFRVQPTPVVQGFSDFFSTQPQSAIVQHNDSYSLYSAFTKISGRHTIKFGAEVRRQITNYIQSNVASGIFNFDNLFTSANPLATGGTGYGYASFMLGYGASGNTVTPVPYSQRNYYAGLYLGDTLQLTQKLSLNYGVRWELPFPFVERYDRYVVLLPDARSPLADSPQVQAAGFGNLKDRMGLVSSPDDPSRHAGEVHKHLVAPRLGVAYRLTSKTVIRAGYGVFYAQNDGGGSLTTTINGPFNGTLDGSLTPNDTLSNPFPNGVLQPPQRNPIFQSSLLGTSVSAPVAGDQREAYTQQFNVTVQKEFAEGTAVELAWGGSRGVHLGGGPTLDQLPDNLLSLGPSVLNQQVPNPFYGLIPATNGSLAARTVQYGQLLRPYPQYTGVAETLNGNRDSTYHSMQIKVQKRFRSGGTILGSYTFSKFLANIESGMGWLEYNVAGIQDNNNLKLEKAVSSFDTRHRLVSSYIVDFPFGKGKKLLPNLNGVADKIVSGWGFNGVSTFQMGYPLGITTASNQTFSFGGGSRPNWASGAGPGIVKIGGAAQDRLSKWFNTAAFVAPPVAAFGNIPRTITAERADGINNWDFSIFKQTALTERFGLQFRTEIFNLFNRVQFAPPGTALGNAQFGVVSGQANQPRLVQFALRLLY